MGDVAEAKGNCKHLDRDLAPARAVGPDLDQLPHDSLEEGLQHDRVRERGVGADRAPEMAAAPRRGRDKRVEQQRHPVLGENTQHDGVPAALHELSTAAGLHAEQRSCTYCAPNDIGHHPWMPVRVNPPVSHLCIVVWRHGELCGTLRIILFLFLQILQGQPGKADAVCPARSLQNAWALLTCPTASVYAPADVSGAAEDSCLWHDAGVLTCKAALV